MFGQPELNEVRPDQPKKVGIGRQNTRTSVASAFPRPESVSISNELHDVIAHHALPLGHQSQDEMFALPNTARLAN